jgi:hypothetical protein
MIENQFRRKSSRADGLVLKDYRILSTKKTARKQLQFFLVCLPDAKNISITE